MLTTQIPNVELEQSFMSLHASHKEVGADSALIGFGVCLLCSNLGKSRLTATRVTY